jgi:hypothetical protein
MQINDSGHRESRGGGRVVGGLTVHRAKTPDRPVPTMAATTKLRHPKAGTIG